MLKVINGAVIDLAKAHQVCIETKHYKGFETGDPTTRITTLWKAGGRFFTLAQFTAQSQSWDTFSSMIVGPTPYTSQHQIWKEVTQREAGIIMDDAGMDTEAIAKELDVPILV